MMPLALTGCGVVSRFGVGARAWFEAARQGLDDGGDPSALPASVSSSPVSLDSTCRAEVAGRASGNPARFAVDFDARAHLGSKGLRNLDRLTTFLIAAARGALEHAGLRSGGAREMLGATAAPDDGAVAPDNRADDPVPPHRLGLCSATAYGSLDAITELNRVAELEEPRYISPSRFPNTVINSAAGYVSIWEDLRGPNTTLVNGNCGSLDAVLLAQTHLRFGRADAMLIGGGEVHSEPLMLAFAKLGLLGHVEVGEGAAYVVAETPANARARGATLRGILSGYGTAFAAPPSEAQLVYASAEAVARACLQALSAAGLRPAEIDVVVTAHSGLSAHDAAEEQGLARVFGSTPTYVPAKRCFGETLGAAGALGMLQALAWFDGAPVGPIVEAGRARFDDGGAPKRVLVVTVGYYGNVSAVVLEHPGSKG